MRKFVLSLLAATGLLVGSAHAEPSPRKPHDTAALTHYTRASRLFGNAAFAEAIEEFKASALVDPAPATDFNLGVCYRLLGEQVADPAAKAQNYQRAIWHYDRFIRSSPETPMRDTEVQKLIDKMRGELANMPAPTATAPRATKPEPAPERPTPMHTDERAVEKPTASLAPQPFYTDVAAWVLTGSGVAALGLGSGLLWRASSLRGESNNTPDQQEQGTLRDEAHTRSVVGTTMAIVGGGVLIGGVIKLIIHDEQATVSSSIAVSFSGNGVAILGRF